MTAGLHLSRKRASREMNNRHPLPHIRQAIGHWIGFNVVPTPLGLALAHPAQQVVLTRQELHLTPQQAIEGALLPETTQRPMLKVIIDQSIRSDAAGQGRGIEEHDPSVEIVKR